MIPGVWVMWGISLLVGIFGGVVGAYLGIKMGQLRLEIHVEDIRTWRVTVTRDIALLNEDSRTHDYELDDVMRKLELPRKKRQNWRFES